MFQSFLFFFLEGGGVGLLLKRSMLSHKVTFMSLFFCLFFSSPQLFLLFLWKVLCLKWANISFLLCSFSRDCDKRRKKKSCKGLVFSPVNLNYCCTLCPSDDDDEKTFYFFNEPLLLFLVLVQLLRLRHYSVNWLWPKLANLFLRVHSWWRDDVLFIWVRTSHGSDIILLYIHTASSHVY